MSKKMHMIPELTRSGLREFGFVTGAMVAVVFGLFFPWVLQTSIPLWPWVVAGILVAWAFVAPESLRPVHYWWMRLALLLSRITTPIILGVVFYMLIFPVGFVMRLFRHDPMRRTLDESTESYRVNSHKKLPIHMERPF